MVPFRLQECNLNILKNESTVSLVLKTTINQHPERLWAIVSQVVEVNACGLGSIVETSIGSWKNMALRHSILRAPRAVVSMNVSQHE